MADHYGEAERVFHSEIEGLETVLRSIEPTFSEAVGIIAEASGKVIVTGIGKSGIVGHKIAATLASTGTPALFVSASEALHGDLGVISEGDVVIMVSNSAATVELARMVPSLKKTGVKIIGIFGRKETSLTVECDLVLDLQISSEACPLNLAPMTSSTVAMVTGDALAAALMKAKGFTPDDFAAYHPSGSLGRKLLLKVEDVMHAGSDLPRVAPEASFKDVVIEMTRANLGGVAVCDKDLRLVGLISDGDVRRALLDESPLEKKAFDLMTRNPRTTPSDVRLAEVLEVMENPERQIYLLPVVAEDGLYQGMIRMHDILQSDR
ncbi:MAG: KpsF/GutQ family sugar-phosphate isomerase [Verrucomicrobiota bacterium]